MSPRLALVLVVSACAARPAGEPAAPPREAPAVQSATAPAGPQDGAPQPTPSAPQTPSVASPAATAPSAGREAVGSSAAWLLGRSRGDVVAALGPPRGHASGGWVTYQDFEVRYRGGRCVGLRRQVPQDMDCQTALESLGFRPEGFPLRRGGGCEWPGISERHRIAPGVAGRYVTVTGQIEVWLRDE